MIELSLKQTPLKFKAVSKSRARAVRLRDSSLYMEIIGAKRSDDFPCDRKIARASAGFANVVKYTFWQIDVSGN